jgi:predicted DNA-binding transcriptional regulator YafY
MFSMDAIEAAHSLAEDGVSIDSTLVDNLVGRDFGIYSGGDRQWAELKFTPAQARWVEAEIWHPEQKATLLEDGSYLLEVPYSNPKELILEILRAGSEVEVLAPPALREEVGTRLMNAAFQYR